MKESVIVRTCKSKATIGQVLKGVFSQSFEGLGDFVVVDSGSTDGNLYIVEGYPHTFVDYSGEFVERRARVSPIDAGNAK